MSHEERLTGEHAFADVFEDAHDAAFVGVGAVAHFGFEGDAVVHVVHAAGFGDDGFAGVEFDFDELHFVAVDLVIDIVGAHGHGGRAACGKGRGRGAGGVLEEGGQDLGGGGPLGLAFGPDEGGGFDDAGVSEGLHLFLGDLVALIFGVDVEPGFHGMRERGKVE